MRGRYRTEKQFAYSHVSGRPGGGGQRGSTAAELGIAGLLSHVRMDIPRGGFDFRFRTGNVWGIHTRQHDLVCGPGESWRS